MVWSVGGVDCTTTPDAPWGPGAEAEQVFFNEPLLMIADTKHSHREPRFHALGRTDEGRTLHITFTLRNAGERIRVISARDMHRKERKIYEQTT